MIRLLLIIFLLGASNIQAQSNLIFNKRFVQCEDKWIAFKMDKDSNYVFGFIYIDEQAGLTFNQEGTFKFNSDNSVIVKKDQEYNVKVRLEPNYVKVAIIPESMYLDLQIDSFPDWLISYKSNMDSISRLYKWGYMYNGWNECEKALEFLLKAHSIDPNFKGVAVELAYSYNCLKEYLKAEEVLEKAILTEPNNAYINKEYIYTLIHKNDINKAISQYKKSIKNKIENTYNAENCFNILGYFYMQKDLKSLKKWEKEFLKWPNRDPKMLKYIKMMKEEIEK